ncbi:MAG: chromosomal replication initiator protein DnaA [Elusimicrobia bacterium]|nr:chromosomal replication initiator protein DnaA [Elusimicrobiota bacterium]
MNTPDPKTLWSQSVERLRSEIGEDADLWLRPVEVVRLADQVLHLKVPNKFFSDGIKDRFQKRLISIIKDVSGQDIGIDYEISTDLKNRLPVSDPIEAPGPQSEFPLSEFNPRYTFASFVVGKSNRLAYATAEVIGKQPGTQYNPFFLYGGVGLGKTHLLHAIGSALRQNFPRSRVLYTTAEEFVNDYINSIHHHKPDDFRAKYRNLDCLLIDDIQFLIAKEQSEQEFFNTFNALHQSKRQIVLTSDRVPNEMTPHERRLVSRFEWGLVADITPPDLETRIAILRKKSELEQFYVPDDVILYVASTVKTNIRLLEGSLIRLKAFASVIGSGLTVESAKEILKDSLPHDVSSPVQLETIQRLVAHKYSLDVRDLKGQQRTAQIVMPRQVAMYLASVMTELSSTDIGRAFGGRDHTTVLHARKKIQKILDEDPFFLELVNKLQSDIKAVEN